MSYKNKRIVILGSKGFLGSVLMDQLPYCYKFGIHRDICDLTNFDNVYHTIKNINPDVVILCATAGGKQNLGEFNKDEFHNNLKIFQNISNLNNHYGLLINIGSGAEMDITTNIDYVKEDEIDRRLPTESYGLAKNIISRYCRLIPNAITLRIFGCFDSNEPDFRLLKKYCNYIKENKKFIISHNREFSWISAIDLSKIISNVIENWIDYPSDINCAYSQSFTISEFIKYFCYIHNLPENFEILLSTPNKNYTCNTFLMDNSLKNINLYGIEKSMQKYII
jgi:nucleoside-diphosphate-sugar epimerase